MAEPTNAELLAAFSALTDRVRLREDQRMALETGTATGGPNGDGYYPITGFDGVVRMKACEERLRVDAARFGVRTITGAGPFTIVAADVGKVLRIGNGSATPNITVRLPNLPEGSQFMFRQIGSGRLNFSGTGGATIEHRQNWARTAGLYAYATAIVDRVENGVSVWGLAGDMSA